MLLLLINLMNKYQVAILYDLICYYINVEWLDRHVHVLKMSFSVVFYGPSSKLAIKTN